MGTDLNPTSSPLSHDLSAGSLKLPTPDSIERSIEIAVRNGLHSRPAMMIVKTVKFFCDRQKGEHVHITKDRETVDGTSIIGVMMLAAGPGSRLHFKVTAPIDTARRCLYNIERLLCVPDAEHDIHDDEKAAALALDPPQLLSALRRPVS